jgi:predicted DNA-binding protein
MMVNLTKRSRYFFDIEPELRNRIKAVAALQGKTMKEWLTEAVIQKLEDDIDAREGLASLVEVEGTIKLKDYLKAKK